MTLDEFRASLALAEPPGSLSVPSTALWWDAKGDWARAHGMVDDLETQEGMAVHAYLHRKEGDLSNARYWYAHANRVMPTGSLEAEWTALAGELLARK